MLNIAPEATGPKRIFNNSIDMWSMGVITYICLCGNFPFDDENMNFNELDNPNFLFGDYSWEDVSDEGKIQFR